MSDKIKHGLPDGNRRLEPTDVPDKSTADAVEPAQGHIDTQPKYRDRPTDDGKYGDGEESPS